MRYITFFVLLLLIFSCKTVKETKSYYYQNEEGFADFYNANNIKKPLLVIIPEVFNSLITEDFVVNLSKKNRVVVIHYLSSTNTTRVRLIDGLQNRLNYYNTVLSNLELDSNSTIVAEGVNANLAIQLGYNFNKPKLVLLNSWYPDLKEKLTTSCYSLQDNSCDSLLNYLSFTDRSQVDALLNGLTDKNSTDNLYGNYTLGVWRNFMSYNNSQLLKMYPSNPRWVYTTNSGLLSEKDKQYLLNSNGKRKDVYLISKKEFLKKYNVLSN